MKTPRIRDIPTILPLLLFGGAYLYFLWWKFRLGQIRFFDADEMAYLHWAHNVYAGRIPMIDFLMYAPPVFLYVISGVFAFFSGTVPLLVARGVTWIVYAGICLTLGMIGGIMRGTKRSDFLPFILPGLVLLVLPIPADKFLEIRPDNLSMLCALVGMLMQLRSIQRSQAGHQDAVRMGYWAGIWYAASLLILPKTLPQVVVGIAVYFLWYGSGTAHERMIRRNVLLRSAYGFLLPVSLFGVWMVFVSGSLMHVGTIAYSLLVLPGEVNRIAARYDIYPNMFFYPNPIYFGSSGWTAGVMGNLVLWLVGLLVGIVRFFTPYNTRGREAVWEVWLPAATLVVYIFAFMFWYPLRHAQYLIPLAVFVALYVSEFLVSVRSYLDRNRVTQLLNIPLYLALIMGMNTLFISVNLPKSGMNNAEDLRTVSALSAIIPSDAYVFDLVGSSIYFRDPFYVSAVPFGEWMPYLSRPLPPVWKSLESTRTRFIYTGLLDRVQNLPPDDRQYISLHFEADPAVNGLLVRKK